MIDIAIDGSLLLQWDGCDDRYLYDWLLVTLYILVCVRASEDFQ